MDIADCSLLPNLILRLKVWSLDPPEAEVEKNHGGTTCMSPDKVMSNTMSCIYSSPLLMKEHLK